MQIGSPRRLSRICALTLAAGLAPIALAQSPFVQIEPLDLSPLGLSAGMTVNVPTRVTNDGRVFGYSTASDNGIFVPPLFGAEEQLWTANGSSVQAAGPRSFRTLDFISGTQFDDATTRNDAGQSIGQRVRQGLDPFDVVLDGWFFDGQNTLPVGLTSAQVNLAANFSNLPTGLNASGTVVGYSTGDLVGLPSVTRLQLAWFAAGGQTTPLGLSGPNFIDPSTNQRSSIPSGLNDAHQIAGWSYLFDESGRRAGTKAWLYSVATNTYETINLTNPAYSNSRNFASKLTQDGTVAGVAVAEDGFVARGAFIYRNGTATEVGLEGSAYSFPFFTSTVTNVFDGGLAFGTTRVRTNTSGEGTAAWVARDGVSRRLGLTSAQYLKPSFEESTYITQATSNGLVAGFSGRVDLPDAPNILGAESIPGLPRIRSAYTAWVQNSADATAPAIQVGLFDAVHTGPNGEQFSVVNSLNEQGFAVGVSNRYNGQVTGGDPDFPEIPAFPVITGASAWLYNFNDNSFTVIPVPGEGDNLDCIPLYVTRLGGVVGFYRDNGGYRPFYWSQRAGFVSLLESSPNLFADPLTGKFPLVVSPDGTRVAIGATLLTGDTALLRIRALETGSACDSIDFNNNTVFPEDQDVIDFFNVLAGQECPTCNDIDFNNNTVFPEDQDVIDFFTVLAGGECS